MANVIIRIAVKDAAWHTANAALVIESGRFVGLDGSSPMLLKVGDGTTQLQDLVWQNLTTSTLEQVLTNGPSTGGQAISSPDGGSLLYVSNGYVDIEINGNRKGSQLYGDDTEIRLYYINTTTGKSGTIAVNETSQTTTHSDLINLNAPSVKKNGYEIATESMVHATVQSNIKIIGDWDATSGSYPLADESNTTPFITQWGATIKVSWAFRVGYGQAGTVGGFYYEEGDVVYSLVDNPSDIAADWGDLDHNLQQANESTRGTAKITTIAIAEDETTTNDETILTPYKFWSKSIPRFKLLANTWNLLQTFSSGIKTSLFSNDTGEFKFFKTVAGTVLFWTNGEHFRFSATVGGAPSMEIDKTTGKVKLLDEVAEKLVKLNADKGFTTLSISENSIVKESFDIGFDGQQGVLTVGANAIKRALPYAGNITSFSIKADVSGSVEIDMKKNGVTMVGAGTKLDLVAASSDSGAITGWTSSTWAVDDELEWSIISATTITKIWLTVKYDKTS